jgi:Mg2+ and Co2+ transporter CorA
MLWIPASDHQMDPMNSFVSRVPDYGAALHQTIDTMKGTGTRTQLLISVSLCILVSSCCTPGVKPEDANLFQASCGLASGEFDRQLESDRNRAASSRQVLDEEKSRSQTLKTDLLTRKAERDRLLTELDEMEDENRRIEAQIGHMRADSAKARQQRTDLQAELVRIQGQVEALKQKTSVEQDALHQYQSEASRLKQEIEILRMIISVQ